MSFCDPLENTILDALLGASATLIGSSVDICLSTTALNDDGTGYTEPSGGSYARQTVTNNGTNFGAAAAGVKSNATEIAFPTATADWGEIVEWFMLEGATVVMHGELDDGAGNAQPRNVYNGDTFKFLVGNLRINLD